MNLTQSHALPDSLLQQTQRGDSGHVWWLFRRGAHP